MKRNIIETIVGALVVVVAVWFAATAYQSTKSDVSEGYSVVAKFDRVDGLNKGSDVRVSGLKVGTVQKMDIDPRTYMAVVTMSVGDGIRLPTDSSAEIIGDGLLGGKYVALVPGAADEELEDGGTIAHTQSAISIEALLGKFIFGGDEDEKDEAAGDESAAVDPFADDPDDVF